MWSNFTDFAIKAQKELQDQANEAASKLSISQLVPVVVVPSSSHDVLSSTSMPPTATTTMSSFFNLDSMQQPPLSTDIDTITTTTSNASPFLVNDDDIGRQQHPLTTATALSNDDEFDHETTTPSTTTTTSSTAIIHHSGNPNVTNDIDNIDNNTNDSTIQNTTTPTTTPMTQMAVVVDRNHMTTTATNNNNNNNSSLSSSVDNHQYSDIPSSSSSTTAAVTTVTSTTIPPDVLEHVDNHNNIETDPFAIVVDDDDVGNEEFTTSHADTEIHNNNNNETSTNAITVSSQSLKEEEECVETTETINTANVEDIDRTKMIHPEPQQHPPIPVTDTVDDVSQPPPDSSQQQPRDNPHASMTIDNNNDDDDDEDQSDSAHTGPLQPRIVETTIRTNNNEVQENLVEVVEVGIEGDTARADNNSSSSSKNIHQVLLSPMTPSPNVQKQQRTTRQRRKLLLLISTNSIDRQVKVRQDLVQMALTASDIEYDILDGSLNTGTNINNEMNVTLRNELFTLSGLRGIYPQFFIVNLDGGDCTGNDETSSGTTFWGTYDEFQHVNDDGQLQQAFGSTSNDDSSTIQSPDIDTSTITRNLYASGTTSGATSSTAVAATNMIPDNVYEKFSQQIQRIEENYQMERQETERRHLQEIQQQQLLYQQCEQTKRNLEETLTNERRQKDGQLQDLYQRNEGYRLKLDVLKREVTGTQELVQGRDHEIHKSNQKFLNDLRAMEKQMNAAEKTAAKYQEQVQTLQIKLDTTELELTSSKLEYETVKERAKSIAMELKDRRSECRQLQDAIVDLTQENTGFKATIDSLEERMNHQGLNQSDKDKEIEALRMKLVETNHELTSIEKVWQEKLTKSENILTEYKKRAQHSLSMSNSRTAAAVQAREEAELDARAARSTADAALERSVKADIECREAIANAKATVKVMEDERDAAIRNKGQLKDEVLASELARATNVREIESLRVTLKNKDMEISLLHENMNKADTKIASTQQKIMELTNIIDDLRQEISVLREELQRAATIAVNDVVISNDEGSGRGIKFTPSAMLFNGSHDAEGDDTLAALRMELREANDAIEDLKSALKNAIEMNEQQQHETTLSHASATIPDNSERSEVGYTGSTDNGAIPLFYAMEKQAELKTARTEMNRLASLLADVQSEKMEAFDAMEEMRRKLDEAESRLKRNEKLGPNVSTQPSDNGNENDHNNNNNASAVNIEYLKHILLRFMNAKTATERKTLVPVIGAVLELTPDEVQAATQNIERTNSAFIVGSKSSLFGFLS